MTGAPPIEVCRLARFGLITRNLDALAAFYERAFGCRRIERGRWSGPGLEQRMGVRGGAEHVTLTLGRQVIELVAFDEGGRPYPRGSSADDPVFQHFAIVVDGMAEAYDRLSAIGGWTPISLGGPQRLPASSGGVTAFKFRDPDGHPLELLQFPEGAAPRPWPSGAHRGACLGLDHSAIAVRDTAASVAFYRRLGLAVSAQTLNQGPEQARLDGLAGVAAHVTALAPPHATPHLELLAYRAAPARPAPPMRANDVASTRLIFEIGPRAGGGPIARLDPDRHRLILEVGPGSTPAL